MNFISASILFENVSLMLTSLIFFWFCLAFVFFKGTYFWGKKHWTFWQFKVTNKNESILICPVLETLCILHIAYSHRYRVAILLKVLKFYILVSIRGEDQRILFSYMVEMYLQYVILFYYFIFWIYYFFLTS